MFQSFITSQLQNSQTTETIDYNAITSELSAIQSRANDLLYKKRRGYINHTQFIECLRALETRKFHLKNKLRKGQ